MGSGEQPETKKPGDGRKRFQMFMSHEKTIARNARYAAARAEEAAQKAEQDAADLAWAKTCGFETVADLQAYDAAADKAADVQYEG